MHLKGDPRERNVGRTAQDRLDYCFGLMEMAIELRLSAIQRLLCCTRQEAQVHYRAEWRKASDKKIEAWKASLSQRHTELG